MDVGNAPPADLTGLQLALAERQSELPHLSKVTFNFISWAYKRFFTSKYDVASEVVTTTLKHHEIKKLEKQDFQENAGPSPPVIHLLSSI